MLELLRGRSKVTDSSRVASSIVLNDRELLARFLAGDEAAFSELVQRHSGLVWGACQRVLRNAEDADDAFQATFLVLARKARSLQWQESIAGWLLETARRTSLKLRAITARRRKVEGLSAQQLKREASASVDSPAAQASVLELTEILDSELAGLPARFREVILLSQVEGLTRDELAERLGISVAAVKDRLERGREQLRIRLLRRGVTLTAATLAVWLVPGTATAAGMTTLVASTTQVVGAFAATGSLATGTTPVAASLAQGVLKMMGFEKMKYISICIVSLLNAGGIAFGMLQDEPTRFEKGLRGNVVAVTEGKPATVTIALEGHEALLNLDVSSSAKVWTAYEVGQLSDLKEGQYVSLRLADDHRTVNEIHIEGGVQSVAIKSLNAAGKITVVHRDDDDDEEPDRRTEVELAPDAILRIGGLPAAREDLKPGMEVELEFGRDGKFVHAITSEAAEHLMFEGELTELNADITRISIENESDDEQTTTRSFTLTTETIVWLDLKPAKLSDLTPEMWVVVRLSDDGNTVRAIKATTPEPEDDDDE